MIFRFSSLLPGISAGTRLGLSEWERGPTISARDDQGTSRDTIDRPSRERLPSREDAFYFSMLHSHL